MALSRKQVWKLWCWTTTSFERLLKTSSPSTNHSWNCFGGTAFLWVGVEIKIQSSAMLSTSMKAKLKVNLRPTTEQDSACPPFERSHRDDTLNWNASNAKWYKSKFNCPCTGRFKGPVVQWWNIQEGKMMVRSSANWTDWSVKINWKCLWPTTAGRSMKRAQRPSNAKTNWSEMFSCQLKNMCETCLKNWEPGKQAVKRKHAEKADIKNKK